MKTAKPYNISKQAVMEAWLKIKRNGGSFGIDHQSIEDFEVDLHKNLYRIWNRMSSGSYFPPPVKGVAIPKKLTGVRILGIPTVSDRVAQMVVKDYLEPMLEPIFHQNSYGYRPNRSALDAIAITRKRCWKYPYLVEFDIRGLFDNLSHDLLLKALRHHCNNAWILLYVERWLKAEMIDPDGSRVQRASGTPQGSVISPVLSNLFMHYGFDLWAEREFKDVPFCRYADDGLLHCHSFAQAQLVLRKLKIRLQEVGLEIHPEKSKIVYCKMNNRYRNHENYSFEFLGYSFKPRMVRSRTGVISLGFTPGISGKAAKALRQTIRRWKLHFRTGMTIEEIAKQINPIIQGWINYYSKFNKTSLRDVWNCLNWHLAKWAGKKYKKLRSHKTRSILFLGKIAKAKPNLFPHWQLNCRPTAG